MSSLDDRGGHQVSLVGTGKRYGAVRALAGVDLEVAAGKFLVLLGPSGSGKTTLVRSLAGIERLDEGEIHIGGRLVSGPGRMCPRRSAIWPWSSRITRSGRT